MSTKTSILSPRRTAHWLLLFPLVGCMPASASYTPLNAVSCARPRGTGDIAIVTRAPDTPHVEAGLIEVDMNQSGQEGTEEALKMMRDLASKHGCHAITLGTVVSKAGQHHDITDDPQNRKQITGTCIVYTD